MYSVEKKFHGRYMIILKIPNSLQKWLLNLGFQCGLITFIGF